MEKSGIFLAIFSGLFVGIAVAACSCFVFMRIPALDITAGSGNGNNISAGADRVDAGSVEVAANKVVVEVAGAVLKPGLYELSASSRVGDALTLAGGLSRDVSPGYFSSEINLAKKIKDEEKIYVPFVWDLTNLTKISTSIAAATVPGLLVQETDSGLVEINKASAESLDALPGIGPAYAERLIENRPYQDWNEVLTKSKVPESVLEKIRSLTTYK